MLKISGGIKNKAVFAQIDNLAQSFRDGIRSGLQQSGIYIAGKSGLTNDGVIKQDINSPKSGREYIVSRGRGGRALKRSRVHVASAAGEAPAVITGKLRKEVYYRVEGSNRLRIGANTDYAKFLEDGTSKMAPRPFVKKNIDKSRADILRKLSEGINSKIK
jgi:HK97 gp10 family phage protein